MKSLTCSPFSSPGSSGPSSRKIRSPRVFVLEDDLELSMIIEQVLRCIDATVSLDWATSAEAAIFELKSVIKLHSTSYYDLIVADIFLDGKSTGIDFWRSCQDLLPETPVLITSSLSFDRFFSTVGNESISPPYLQKPFTLSECKQMFESMLKYSSSKRRDWTPNRYQNNFSGI